MLKYAAVMILTILLGSVEAQVVEAEKPIEFCSKGVCGMGFSKGISFKYELIPGFNLNSAENNGSSSAIDKVDYIRRLEGKVKVPLLNKPGLKLLGGFKYAHEEYRFAEPDRLDFDLHNNLENKSLKTVSFALYGLKPTRSKYYLGFAYAAVFKGDFEGFIQAENQNRAHKSSFLVARKHSKNVEFGLGIGYANDMGLHSILPIVMYNHTFNDKFGIEALLPKELLFRYNISSNAMLFVGAEGDNESYLINVSGVEGVENNMLRLHRSEIKYTARLEKALFGPLCFAVEGGYRQNLNFDFALQNAGKSEYFVQSNASNGFFTALTLFIKPPQKKSGK